MINSKQELESFVCKNWEHLNNYIDDYSKDLPIPIYTSVDIRESSSSYAPVDNNLYPAGFNNICFLDQNMATERFKKYLPNNVKKIGLIPESHTKNKYYLDNLFHLKIMIESAGFDVQIISPDSSLFQETKKIDLISQSEHPLEIYYKESLDDFDLIILNNDQSSPLNINWADIKKPVYPAPFMGWTNRQKNTHFQFYDQVLKDFCQKFEINSDLMQARFRTIEGIDFSTKEGFEQLSKEVRLLQEKIGDNKTVFLKASQGTYGMGIMVVNTPEEVLSMNRKKRNKMDVGKNSLKFTSVLIQEGIETIIKYDDMPAEVTIYSIGGKSTGGFMRANPLKGTNANLNARGMIYQKFCISEITQDSEHKAKEAVYSCIARLSTIATAMEIQQQLKVNNETV